MFDKHDNTFLYDASSPTCSIANTAATVTSTNSSTGISANKSIGSSELDVGPEASTMLFLYKEVMPLADDNILLGVIQKAKQLVASGNIRDGYETNEYLVKSSSKPRGSPHVIRTFATGKVMCDNACQNAILRGYCAHALSVAIMQNMVETYINSLSSLDAPLTRVASTNVNSSVSGHKKPVRKRKSNAQTKEKQPSQLQHAFAERQKTKEQNQSTEDQHTQGGNLMMQHSAAIVQPHVSHQPESVPKRPPPLCAENTEVFFHQGDQRQNLQTHSIFNLDVLSKTPSLQFNSGNQQLPTISTFVNSNVGPFFNQPPPIRMPVARNSLMPVVFNGTLSDVRQGEYVITLLGLCHQKVSVCYGCRRTFRVNGIAPVSPHDLVMVTKLSREFRQEGIMQMSGPSNVYFHINIAPNWANQWRCVVQRIPNFQSTAVKIHGPATRAFDEAHSGFIQFSLGMVL